MNKTFSFEVEGQVGILTLDVPGERVNILSTAVMTELDRWLDEIRGKAELQSLVFISGKPENFIAGASLAEIEGITDPIEGARKAAMGQAVFDKLQELPLTSIAAIDGACVGGGLELALACDFRLARDTKKTRIGLPEVRLGIIPGFGGTQRLPRLIGIQPALQYILTGKLVDARRAYKAGIVDRLVPAEFESDMLRTIAIAFATEMQSPELRAKIKSRRKKQNPQDKLLESNFVGRRVLFDQARKRVKAESQGHYPAPLLALEAVEKGFPLDLKAGLAIEAELLGKAIVTPVSKNLVKVFYLTEAMRKDAGVDGFSGATQSFSRVGVLGAGFMGGGIAQLLAFNDLPVRMKDINYAAVAKGMEAAAKVFSESVKKRRLTRKEMQSKMGFISGTTDYSGFHAVDLVIEAIVEDLEIKKKTFAELDEITPKHTILASNTSSLSVTAMAAATTRPDKVAGLHFFSPVHRMPLVEVIRGEQTSDATVASLVAFAKSLGKTPIVVKDAPGFLVNRILGVYMAEASRLLHDGSTIGEVDKALVAFGMPLGPFNLIDEVGLAVAAKVAKILIEAFGNRMKTPASLDKLVTDGRLGKIAGKGFYRYAGKEKAVDPAVYTLFGMTPSATGQIALEEIRERAVLLMINEATMCLAEGIVRRPQDVDAGMIFGTGFPPFRGGLLRYADDLGITQVVERMEHYAAQYGDHFKPADLLNELNSKGQRFYN